MKWLIVGDGIQGKKRKAILGSNCIGILDPFSKSSDFKTLEEIETTYEIVAICTSQEAKEEYLRFFSKRGKPCLVEKPFPILSLKEFQKLESTCSGNGTFIYTAFNHRYEESIVELRKIISSGEIGNPYLVNMKYGNGTIQDIIKSTWKNSQSGLLFDLGSHLIDLYQFVIGKQIGDLKLENYERFESNFADYVRISGDNVLLEIGYIYWKSDFRLEIWGSKGSVHALGLKKWGNSELTVRKRRYPSGIPNERTIRFEGADSTWIAEHHFVEGLVRDRRVGIDPNSYEVNEKLLRLSNSL